MGRYAVMLTILVGLVFAVPLAAPQDTAIGQILAPVAEACSGPFCRDRFRRPVVYRQPVYQQQGFQTQGYAYQYRKVTVRKPVKKAAKCCVSPTVTQTASGKMINKISPIKTIAKGDGATAATTVTQSNSQHVYNFHGASARPMRGGGVATNLRSRAAGAADFKRSELDITTVTCTLSTGGAGVVAKVKGTGRPFCVTLKVAAK